MFVAKKQNEQDALYNVINSDRLSQWEKHQENAQNPCDYKDISLLFGQFTSSANAKSFQFTPRNCFWFSWTQNPHRRQQTGAGLGVADWVEPRMLRTTMEQCSSSLASELSLPWLPRQTLREEQTSVPFGEESEYMLNCLSAGQYLHSKRLHLVSPFHTHQRWSNPG